MDLAENLNAVTLLRRRRRQSLTSVNQLGTMISPKATGWILGGAHFVIWCVFGLWVIPKFTQIFAEMLNGASLPWMARSVLFVGPAGCLLVAAGGGALLVAVHLISVPRWLRQSFIILFSAALAYAVIALGWPMLLDVRAG